MLIGDTYRAYQDSQSAFCVPNDTKLRGSPAPALSSVITITLTRVLTVDAGYRSTTKRNGSGKLYIAGVQPCHNYQFLDLDEITLESTIAR